MLLDPKQSKRQRFGVYEFCLNRWIRNAAVDAEFVIDVGAGDGYYTFGFAHLLCRLGRNPTIISLEPGSEKSRANEKISKWPEYASANIKVIPKFGGEQNSEDTTTLDTESEMFELLTEKKGIVKIDVEGHEVKVLKGATQLLTNRSVDWAIEIHGKRLIPEVSAFFVDQDRPFLILEEFVFPILGKEAREIETYWLVTI